MTTEAEAGAIVAIVVAIVAGFGWIISYVQRCEDRATEARHDLRSEINLHMLQLEERLSSRIAALERYSLGFREHYQHLREGKSDG